MITSIKSVRGSRSYLAPNSFLAKALPVIFIMQSLPDIRGIDLPAFKSLPDLTVLQDKYPVRGQRDALQDMGRKQHSPILFIARNLLVQIFRTLEIQAVDRLVQKEQPGFQGKSRDQKCFFPVSG